MGTAPAVSKEANQGNVFSVSAASDDRYVIRGKRPTRPAPTWRGLARRPAHPRGPGLPVSAGTGVAIPMGE